MQKKHAISRREQEALSLLRMALPEFEVFPNMRLADVVRVPWRDFNRVRGFHLDFVICTRRGFPLGAVELDDATHDSERARERDARKDAILMQADIPLLRIRHIDELGKVRPWLEGLAKTHPGRHVQESVEEGLDPEKRPAVGTVTLEPVRLSLPHRALGPLLKYVLSVLVVVVIVAGMADVMLGIVHRRSEAGQAAQMRQQALEAAQREAEAHRLADEAAAQAQRAAEQAAQFERLQQQQEAEKKAAAKAAERESAGGGTAARGGRGSFDELYRKPPECESPATTKVLFECSNDYIRARKKFDETGHL
ncbi:MAG: DUF2726 domain-containing protein [Pseudomonadota bacterium]